MTKGVRILLLSPANINDIALAPALLAAAGPIQRLIAEKAYYANSLLKLLAEQGAKAVILSTPAAANRSPTANGSTASAT